LSIFLGIPHAIAAGLLPFLIGDGIKLAGAGLVLPAAWALVK
jgi:biotin transporter BioY